MFSEDSAPSSLLAEKVYQYREESQGNSPHNKGSLSQKGQASCFPATTGHSSEYRIHPLQQKGKRQTSAAAWQCAAFRKTQHPSVFRSAESLSKRKMFYLCVSTRIRRFSYQSAGQKELFWYNVRTATANRYQFIIKPYTIPQICDIRPKKVPSLPRKSSTKSYYKSEKYFLERVWCETQCCHRTQYPPHAPYCPGTRSS